MNTPSFLTSGGLFHGCMLTLCGVLLLSGCTTTKQKDDLSGLGMMYQNMTAHYNGYFNATEIMKESVTTLETEYQDNYNQILPVFEYTAVADPKSVAGELDEAIKKSSVVISLHRPSKWTDDCYLLIGQAQYLKQDFESAQKTLEYMVNNFDDTGKSTAKAKEKPDKAATKAERLRKIQEKNKEIQERKKAAAKDRAERNKEIKATKKEKTKTRKQEKKAREKASKQRKKERERANKARKKARKKGKKYKKPSSSSSSSSSSKTTEEKTETETKKTTTPVKEAKPVPAKKEKTEKEKTEKEKKEEDKKPKKEDKVKDGALAHKPAKPYGMLWLAKTYVERDFITQADRLFRQAEASSGSDEKLQTELFPSMAHFYIYTEQYNDAIGALEQAIETEKRKALKARYSYIIGQLKMKSGDHSSAVAYFDQAASWSREYEMEFNAKLNSKLASMSAGSKSEEAIAKELEKMLKDDKNEEYKGQIYFQIAKVYIESGNDIKAEEYLNLALENASNPMQKTEIHYALGEIYYNKDKFDLAYDSYSTALTSMPKTDRRYRSVEERKTNLKEIAQHLKALNLQDSLNMLASLSDDELKERAEQIIEERRVKQEEAEEKLAAISGKSASMAPALASSQPIASSTSIESKFFAYNDKALKKGEREFAKTWGSRAFADDWRRSETASVETVNNEVDVELESTPQVTSTEVGDIFKGLPKTDEEKAASNAKIGDALYNLGMAYRNNIERLDLSSESFLRFVQGHKEDARLPEAYYFLYLNAKDQNDNTTAARYASILQDKYPDSKYALIAADPNYINTLTSDENSVEAFYQSTYAAFEAGDYKRAHDAFDQAKNNFGTNDYTSKFALLQAMSVGKLKGKEEYIESLRTVVAQYPNTPEQIRAREIIRFLGGDDDAFSKSWQPELVVSNYRVEDDNLHYVVVVIFNDDVVKMDQAKISINNYNNLFHKLEKYSIRSFIVNRDDKTPAVLIRKFDGKKEAMQYYTEVSGRMAEFLPEEADAEVYAIGQNNYREMIKSGGIESYKSFFADNYLR